MAWRSRILVLVSCLAASACFGGPTSEWPREADGDGTKGPGNGLPGGGGGLDAGTKPSPSIDAGAAKPVADESECSDGETDAGTPLDAAVSPRLDASQSDAGCS